MSQEGKHVNPPIDKSATIVFKLRFPPPIEWEKTWKLTECLAWLAGWPCRIRLRSAEGDAISERDRRFPVVESGS